MLTNNPTGGKSQIPIACFCSTFSEQINIAQTEKITITPNTIPNQYKLVANCTAKSSEISFSGITILEIAVDKIADAIEIPAKNFEETGCKKSFLTQLGQITARARNPKMAKTKTPPATPRKISAKNLSIKLPAATPKIWEKIASAPVAITAINQRASRDAIADLVEFLNILKKNWEIILLQSKNFHHQFWHFFFEIVDCER